MAQAALAMASLTVQAGLVHPALSLGPGLPQHPGNVHVSCSPRSSLRREAAQRLRLTPSEGQRRRQRPQSVRAQAAEGGWFRIPFFGGKKKEPQPAPPEEEEEVSIKVISEEVVPPPPPPPPPEEVGVAVVGAGLAGLAAARALHRAGVPFVVLEASDGVGGRVRTDSVDGFLLDRGFQIFLSAYPEAQAVLDYSALDLRPFYAGALVRLGDGTLHRVADPFRHPLDGVASLPNPIGSIADKIRVGLLRLQAVSKSFDTIWREEETSVQEALRAQGFSDSMIDRFFRPFLGGIFFDRDLSTSSRLLNFVIKVLALGPNTLPAQGIGAIAKQLASQVPPDAIRLNARVTSITPSEGEGGAVALELADGKRLLASQGAVVAVEQPQAEALLGEALKSSPSASGEPRATVCLYFSVPSPPSPEPILYLNGSAGGLINNLSFPSTVAPAYAPEGKSLASVSLVGVYSGLPDPELEQKVREELKQWFPSANVDDWEHIRTYRIPFAQPDQRAPSDLLRPQKLPGRIYVSGDHRRSATFDGALVSGREAAEALIADAAAEIAAVASPQQPELQAASS